MKESLAGALAIAFGLLSPSSLLFAEEALNYQDRGNHWEGVKPTPVSGSDIELISATIDFVEPVTSLPSRIKVRFYLPSQTNAYITVRELDNRFFYWMDEVKPGAKWTTGFGNEFAWDTAPVLRILSDQGLALSDLGALVRLGKDVPSAMERVAPALMYHSKAPHDVSGYLFTMKTAADASVRCSIFKEGVDRPLAVETFRRARGGRPFTMHWDAKNAEPGEYRLVVSGYQLDDNQPVVQTIVFHHRLVIM